MKIKEIRNFKNLSFKEQRAKITSMKHFFYFFKSSQIATLIPILSGGYNIIECLKNGENPSNIIQLPLALFITYVVLSRASNYYHNDIIEAETIMRLEADELTLKKTKKD